jgi:hypothetical protein
MVAGEIREPASLRNHGNKIQEIREHFLRISWKNLASFFALYINMWNNPILVLRL